MAVVPEFPATVAQPDFSSTRDMQARVLESEFGDGYTQRAADGINTLRASWSLTWTNVSTVEMRVIDDFLKARKGWESFWWTAPGDELRRRWTCKQWKVQPTDAGYWKVTASFREEFDL